MAEKTWSKFHPLFGSDLKVGFETTFPRDAVLGLDSLDSLYARNNLVYDPGSGPIKRIYEPVTKIVGSCVDGDVALVFFEPVSQTGSLFRRLVFARKVEAQGPRYWMVAARHGEVSHFGFDSWNSKDQRYLALGYGIDEQFIPTFFKVYGNEESKEDGKASTYLKVWAFDDGPQIVVTSKKINEKDAPEHLRSAKPDKEGVEAKLVYSV